MDSIQSLLSAAKGNPRGMYDQMIRTNPQFAAFVRDNAGKTPQQIAQDYGIDWGTVSRYLR